MSISLPKSVNIGSFDYEIVEWPHREAQACRRFGEFSSIEQVIRIDTSQSIQRVRDTLLHEIMHGVMYTAKFDDVDHPNEEFIVSSAASILTQVMVANPEVREWFALAWASKE